MREGYAGANLYGPGGERKYLNAGERRRFLNVCQHISPEDRLFCLALAWSGGRISEVLALLPALIDGDSGTVGLHTLKRRKRGIVRQVPLPRCVFSDFNRVFHLRSRQLDPELANRRLWRWSRTTAWRRVKAVMTKANIFGLQATPKGLRHSFGVHAVQSGVPLPLLQRWMGHASLKTTAIYLDVIGPEERGFAARMWFGQFASADGATSKMRTRPTAHPFAPPRSWPRKPHSHRSE
jgi:integrase/recombinase XerD